jgi:hypothetical protein
MAGGQSKSGAARSARGRVVQRRRAIDPFFIFTYSLLALAGTIQFLIMIWMDVF